MSSVSVLCPSELGAASAVTLADSFRACRLLASSHYENFSVLSRLLPHEFRDDFAAVYAFCRTADDVADDLGPREGSAAALAALNHMHSQVDLCADFAASRGAAQRSPGYDSSFTPTMSGAIRGVGPDALDPPCFPALADTIARRRLSPKPFHDLLDAFQQDQHVRRYDSWEQVVDYCTRSADPVGRIVLEITGHIENSFAANTAAAATTRDHLFSLSDSTCTALQLTNFWQDVARDALERDRIYIPRESMDAVGLREFDLLQMIRDRRPGPAFRTMLASLVDRTRPLFARGRALWPLVNPDFRPVIQLFTAGGESILHAIQRRDYDVLAARPRLSSARKAWLVFRAWIGHTAGVNAFGPASPQNRSA